MKRLFVFILAVGVLPWPTWAVSRPPLDVPDAVPARHPPQATATPTPDEDDEEDEGYFYTGLSVLVVLPTQSQGSLFQEGGGGGLCGGYDFGDGVALQMEMDGFYFYGPNATSIYTLQPLAELKLYMDLDDFEPYVLVGPGLNINFIDYNNYASASSVNLVSVFGLGAQLPVADDLLIYAEGKYTIIYYSRSAIPNGQITQDIPLEAGIIWAP